MIYITDATYVNDYKIHLQFNDEQEGVVDLKDAIYNDHRAIFQELKDLKIFKNFRLDMDTIVWNNGLDLAPEFLHSLAIKNQNHILNSSKR